MRHRIGPALAGSLLALVLGACGSADADEDVPSANGGGAGPTASSSAGAGGDAQKYAQCIRDNGVPDFPDPDPDGGFSNIDVQGLDRNALTKAMQACQDQAPAGVSKLTGKLTPEQAEKWTKYAGCMRDSGIDMPDPDPNGSLQDWAKDGLGNVNRDDPKFKEASKTCQQKANINLGVGGR
jgi:hypothetical protein